MLLLKLNCNNIKLRLNLATLTFFFVSLNKSMRLSRADSNGFDDIRLRM